MKIRRNKGSNLDEMQEQKMLHIEKYCFWGMYWMLAASIVIQLAMGCSMREIAGESIPFFAICIFMVEECLRQGIWDRRLKADRRTNLMVSGVAAAVVLVIMTVFYAIHSFGERGKSIGIFAGVVLIPTVLTLVFCMAALSICAAIYKKRVEAIDRHEDEEDEQEDD